MKRMERISKALKKTQSRIENFFAHFPLFTKYLTIMTSMILVSYLVLASALFVFLSNRWSREKREVLTENVRQNAEYCEQLLERCETEEDLGNAMIIICNNLGVSSNAIGADIVFCNTEGEVIICKEDFKNGFVSGHQCMIHSGFTVPESIMAEVEKGTYFNNEKIDGLFESRTFFAGEAVKVGGQTVGAIFASDPIQHSFGAYASSLLQMYLSSAVFAVALTFLVAYAFTAKMTKPLRQMSSATKAYAQGDFSKRVSVRGSDELSELCQSFNRMASALAVLESSRRSFVANVSHELKTPMTTIGGFIDGMLDGTIPPERHEEYLQKVSNEIKRLSRLVTSMLNLSKIEAGELELKYSKFDVSQVIIDCMLNFEQVIDKNNITVEGFEDMGAVTVYADRDMLHQVIYNLVDNAVKFTNKGGKISVFAENRDDGSAVISIQNTGDGISPEEISRIFERFYKVDKSRSYDVKSAGLGLYLCKTIVEMHQGKIYAESVEGQFARFTVLLGRPPQDKSKK